MVGWRQQNRRFIYYKLNHWRQGIKTINEIVQEYGVHPTQVNQWKKELLDNGVHYIYRVGRVRLAVTRH